MVAKGWTRESFRSALEDTPLRFRQAVARSATARVRVAERVDDVVVLDPGDSGVAGRAVAALAARYSEVPVVYSPDSELPAFVTEHSVVLVVAALGTEAVDDALAAAAAAGAVCLEVGGDAGARPRQATVTSFGVDSRGLARAVFGEIVGTAVGALAAVGVVAEEFFSTAESIAAGGTSDADVHAIVGRIGASVPVFVGAGPLGEVAALRAKASYNQNCRAPAFAIGAADAFRYDIHGWGINGDVTRQVFTLVRLRTGSEGPSAAADLDRYVDAVDEAVSDVVTVSSVRDGELAGFLDLVRTVDLVSVGAARDIEPHVNSEF